MLDVQRAQQYALANLKILERENLVENSAKMGDYLLEQLQLLKLHHSVIGDVRGKGLLLGIELVSDRQTKTPVTEDITMKIVAMCMKKGLL
ncbi:aminotransferase class III-fold pyridoxal phosphate-dependent enzyme [Psychromonas sp. KJ10-10]|uniref:aminotransferase class III-fold pyridoxal phosphate-dependent enzyme n=1 Tax=Psychromonas sp. KJ10-10 TaxID=3391823 RepID=UPI0039B3D6ED